MTPKEFYDWQTAGGTDDVMRLVDCLERADISRSVFPLKPLQFGFENNVMPWLELLLDD